MDGSLSAPFSIGYAPIHAGGVRLAWKYPQGLEGADRERADSGS